MDRERERGRRGTGDEGERLARRYLQRRGFRILDVNWKGRRGELDLVARHRGTIVFVEVRSKRSARYGSAIEALDWRKQQQVRRVAEEYLTVKGLWGSPVRFDAVLVDWSAGKAAITHVPHAF